MSAATTFIARSDFVEGVDDAANRPEMPAAEAFGHSTFDGVVVFANIERTKLQKMLPRGLTLAGNGKYPGLHPVMHLAGLQGHTGWSLPGQRPHWVNMPYHEFILFIPFVLHPGSPQWHNFVVRMYLTSEIARGIGELFNYRKVIGFVNFNETHIRSFLVTDGSGHQAFSSQDTPSANGFVGDAAAANSQLPNFEEIVQILGMPILGSDPADESKLLCSYFNLDFSEATITAIDSTFKYAAGFDPPTLAPDERTNVPDGAILIQKVSWTLQFRAGPCDRHVATLGTAQQGSRASFLCASCSGELPKDARFCPSCGIAVDSAARSERAGVHGSEDGERRQASVVFVDLIGSTTLASTMDPEVLRQLLRQFRSIIERVVTPYGGMIAQYFGDGVLIFFGYPKAREDAAEHAVSAALEVVQAVRAEDSSGRLRVRVGVATGIFVTGEQGSRAFSLGDVAVGGPPWLASALQILAPIDGVVIANETWNVAGHLFECRSMGGQSLRGYAEKVPAWLVFGPRRSAGRFAARRAVRGPVPIIGRDADVQTLVETWQRVKESGKGALVTVVGDAGIGKSRLVEALYDRIGGGSFVSLQYHCGARFRNTALYPVIAQIERAAGFEREDAPATRLDKLDSLLAQWSAGESLARSVAYIASLLSVPFGPPYPAIPEAPDRRKEGVLSTLESYLEALASGEPLLLLVEDWHWADPSTQELLRRASRVIAQRPVMAVLTSRSDIATDWLVVEPVAIRLHRLADADCEPLIAHVAGEQGLPRRVVEQVLKKAEGVPLFLEEITRTLVDARALGDAAGGAGASPSFAVPSTLRDLMQSRLDSHARAKEVAQVGAAIGREFSYGLLRMVHQSSDGDLQAALDALEDADVVQRRGTYPDAQFLFKHALIQDAAYETMLFGARPGIHREIAKAMLASDPDVANLRPEVLAHHFTEAGSMLEASEHFHQAGMRASSRAANVEAGEHFRAAIRVLAPLPANAIRHEIELANQVELGLTITALKGYAATEVGDVYERARHLCALLGNDVAHFPVLRGLCTYYMVRAQFDTALDLASECSRISEETGRTDHRIEATATLGYTLVYMGRLADGRRRLEEAVATYGAATDESITSATVRHGVMAAFALLAIVAWMQGDHDYSAHCSEKSTELAKAAGRPFDLAYASCFAAMLANFQGDTERAVRHAEHGIACASEHAFQDWLMAGKAQRAIAGILRGEAKTSRATLEETARQWQATGAELNRHVFIAGHAAAMLATFDVAGALARIDEAIAHGERLRERWLDAEMHRLRGMILEYTPNSAVAAADAYRRAVQIAMELPAPYLALRSAVRLWACDRNAGRPTDAMQLVQTIVEALPADARKSAEFATAARLLAA